MDTATPDGLEVMSTGVTATTAVSWVSFALQLPMSTTAAKTPMAVVTKRMMRLRYLRRTGDSTDFVSPLFAPPYGVTSLSVRTSSVCLGGGTAGAAGCLSLTDVRSSPLAAGPRAG